MFKIFILSSLLTLITQINSLDVPNFKNLQDVIKLATDIRELFSEDINFKESSIKDENNPVNPVIQLVETISSQIEKIPDQYFSQYTFPIDFVYENFIAYASDLSNYNDDTIKEFIEMVTGEADKYIPSSIEELKKNLVSSEDSDSKSIWQSMISAEKGLNQCDMNTTLQERIFESYKLIVLIELKVLIVTEGANQFQAGLSNTTSESKRDTSSTMDHDKPKENFVTRVQEYFTELQKIIETASRELYRCDSKTHNSGEDFVELEGVFYSYVMNEYEIGRRPSCGRECSEIESWGIKRCSETNYEKNCPGHPCKGLIHDCGWIGGDVDICEEGPESIKRYRFVRSYSNGWYGKWDRCDGGRYYEYRSAMLRFSSCSTCICTCSESLGSSRAIRTISLRPQISSIEENKVVVDVKFVSEDQMIQVQIQQAPLQPNGEVDKSQAEWVPLENVTYDSKSNEGSFLLVEDGFSTLERNVDFSFITKDDNILNIDQISGGSGYVLTGVRFSRQLNSSESDSNEDQLPGPIELEIRVTPYDYSTGQLNTEEDQSKWIKASDQPNPPEAYNDEREDLGVGWKGYKFESDDIHHTPDTEPNKFTKFIKSSIHSDIGQSVFPLFDNRPVESENKMALNGLGIIYLRANEFGGLLAFEHLTISLADGFNSGTDEAE